MTKENSIKMYKEFRALEKTGKNEAIRRNAKLHAEQLLKGHPYLAVKPETPAEKKAREEAEKKGSQ